MANAFTTFGRNVRNPVCSRDAYFSPSANPASKAYDVIMMDRNYISGRLNTMRQEISDINTATVRYWSKSQHTTLDKSAKALRQGRVLQMQRELLDLKKRRA